jgi:hypothetical protein
LFDAADQADALEPGGHDDSRVNPTLLGILGWPAGTLATSGARNDSGSVRGRRRFVFVAKPARAAGEFACRRASAIALNAVSSQLTSAISESPINFR